MSPNTLPMQTNSGADGTELTGPIIHACFAEACPPPGGATVQPRSLTASQQELQADQGHRLAWVISMLVILTIWEFQFNVFRLFFSKV